MREWVADMDDLYVEPRYEPEEFIVCGWFVVRGGPCKGPRASRRCPAGCRHVPCLRILDRLRQTRRFWAYLDRAEALEAVGLSE